MALTERIQEVEKSHHRNNKIMASTNRCLFTESINKYWCGWGKDKKPRDMITELRIPHTDPPLYTSNSSELQPITTMLYSQETSTAPPHPKESPASQNASHKLLQTPQCKPPLHHLALAMMRPWPLWSNPQMGRPQGWMVSWLNSIRKMVGKDGELHRHNKTPS